MAIAFDAASQATPSGGTSSLTWSHTVSGSNRILLVAIDNHNSGRTVSSVTYNGVAMTLARQHSYYGITSVYKLLAPDTGTHDIVVTMSGSGALSALAASYTGVQDTGAVASKGEHDNNTNAIEVSITLQATNSWTFSAERTGDPVTTSGDNNIQDQGETERAEVVMDALELGVMTIADKSHSSSGATTLGFHYISSPSAETQRLVVVEIKEGTQAQNYTQDLDETITLAETRTNQTGKQLEEVATLAEAFATVHIFNKALSEVITLVDTMLRTATKVVTETVTLVDTAIRNMARTFVDVVTLVADSATSLVYSRAFSDEITLNDTLTRTATKVLSETITAVDTAVRTVTKALTDVVTLVASEGLEVTIGRMFTETITLVDNMAKATSKAFTEVISLIETFAKRITALRLTESITLVASLATLKTRFKALTEQVVLAETIAKVLTATRDLTETVTIRVRAFANGINLQWLSKYTNKISSWLNKYDDPK